MKNKNIKSLVRNVLLLIVGTILLVGILFLISGRSGEDFFERKKTASDFSQGEISEKGGANASSPHNSPAPIIAQSNSVMTSNSYSVKDVRNDQPKPNVIYLNAGPIDTDLPGTKARRQPLAYFSGKRLQLIQWRGAVQPSWIAELNRLGVEIVDYIPENAYLVYGDWKVLSAMQKRMADKDYVRWEGMYRATDKIQPGALEVSREEPDLFAVQMVLNPQSNPETLKTIRSLQISETIKEEPAGKYYNVITRLPPEEIAKLAERPDIISIGPYATPKMFCERQAIIMASQLNGNVPMLGAGYLNWLAGKGFTQAQFDASGLVVDVTDSPIDNGTVSPNHFALYKDGTIVNNSPSRVVYSRLEGTANTGSVTQAQDGHGNLDAHIIGGQVNLNTFPHVDSSGYHFGMGICPFVKLGGSIIFDTSRFTSPNYDNLAARAYRDGARVSGNSWGADTAGGYDVDAQNYDRLVRDAQPSGSAVATAGNQQMTFVFAAGNAGSGASTVGSPGTAKNVITAGASENVHPFGGSDSSGVSDTGANSANDVIDFSSRGPCADQRKKPDIMAPGTHVTGGVPQAVKTMSGTGAKLAIFDGSGVSGGVNSIYFPSAGQQFYTASSGTSHSTPAVAGAAALVYQWFINKGWASTTNPVSPAMVKAYLMNASRYMTGVFANDNLYSNNQGMGMVNLDTSFDTTPRLLRDQMSADLFTASGQSRTWSGIIASSSKPVRITVAWTDAPGSTTGNAYKNNLDLTVTVNGTTYKGNVFTGANSTTGGTADVRNNVESVFLPVGTTGNVTVTVTATNINSDGVPNVGTTLDQDFALVAYNFSESQAAAVVGAGSTLVAEESDSTNNALDPQERVTVTFNLRNVGNMATTNLTATLLQTNGVTPVTTNSVVYGALSTNGAIVARNFDFIGNGDCGSVVTAVLALQDGTNNLGTASFDFFLGTFSSVTATNTNAAAITIRDTNSATPYPSSINISGRTGTISKVTVTIPAFSHTYSSDVNMVLVSPSGKKVALMGGVGGSTKATNLVVSFDDAGSGPIGTSLTSGTYQPSGTVSTMPTGAPVGPYASRLSEFNGDSANGIWSLYVSDKAGGDTGSIGQGWRIAITTGQWSCLGVNQPPTVTLNSPADGSAVLAGQSVNLSATASDLAADGTAGIIKQVDFFEGTNRIATGNLASGPSATYTAAWSPSSPGPYVLTAKATDSEDLFASSAPVNLGVLSGDGKPVISSFAPTSGAPDSVVVISGSNFAGVSAVRFNGLAAASFSIDSTTQITAIVPAAATTGPISVVNTFGTGTSLVTFTILQSPVLISQVYGAGGSSGAGRRNDYVELYNRSGSTQSLSNWTVQYAKDNGTSWTAIPLSGSLAPGRYYLLQLASSGTAGSTLPTPDGTGSINISASTGKMALRSSATVFTGSTPIGQTGLEDLVGYGTSASAFEGAGAAPTPSTTTAIFRAGAGATDTQNNNSDFAAASSNPRNSSSGSALAPVITSTNTASGTVGQSFTYTITATNSPTSFGATGLPANLLVDTATGLISGTPSTAGTSTVTISATNSAGTDTKTLILTVSSSGGGGSELFREDFASITTGNSTNTAGSSSPWSGNTNFTSVSDAYQAGGAVRLGASANSGFITSRVINLSSNSGSFTVTYKVKGWTTSEGNIRVTVGSVSQTNSYVAVMADAFETKTLNFTNGTTNSMVKFETTSKRAFIDDVVVNSSAPPSPTVSAIGPLSAVSTTYGSASSAIPFTVSGQNLTNGIIVTPPLGFEVSQTSGGTTGYAATQTVGGAGTVTATTVYLRLAAGTSVGTYAGNVVCNSADAAGVSLAVPSSEVLAKALTITVSNRSKPFGTTLSLGPGQNGFSSTGLEGGQTIGSVTLSANGGTAANDPMDVYLLSPSEATGGTFSPSNYSITYRQGQLTVTGVPFSSSTPSADSDGNGLSNLMEYYMGISAESPLSGPPVTVSNSGTTISMTYRRYKGLDGVQGTVEHIGNLTATNWDTNGVTVKQVVDRGTYEEVTVEVALATGSTRMFMRLRVTQP